MADVNRSLGTPTLCRQVLRHHSPPTARHGNLTESVHQVQLTCGFHAVALRSDQCRAHRLIKVKYSKHCPAHHATRQHLQRSVVF